MSTSDHLAASSGVIAEAWDQATVSRTVARLVVLGRGSGLPSSQSAPQTGRAIDAAIRCARFTTWRRVR